METIFTNSILLIKCQIKNTTLSEQVQNRFRKVIETDAILKSPNTHIYVTGHFTSLVYTLQ